jgi:hypothetical protein
MSKGRWYVQPTRSAPVNVSPAAQPSPSALSTRSRATMIVSSPFVAAV